MPEVDEDRSKSFLAEVEAIGGSDKDELAEVAVAASKIAHAVADVEATAPASELEKILDDHVQRMAALLPRAEDQNHMGSGLADADRLRGQSTSIVHIDDAVAPTESERGAATLNETLDTIVSMKEEPPQVHSISAVPVNNILDPACTIGEGAIAFTTSYLRIEEHGDVILNVIPAVNKLGYTFTGDANRSLPWLIASNLEYMRRTLNHYAELEALRQEITALKAAQAGLHRVKTLYPEDPMQRRVYTIDLGDRVVTAREIDALVESFKKSEL